MSQQPSDISKKKKAPRPSPCKSATLYTPNTKRKGNDGRMYVVAVAKNGVQRWKPVTASTVAVADAKEKRGKVGGAASTRTRLVNIIDNGGRTFYVELSGTRGPGTARVFALRDDKSDEVKTDDPSFFRFWKELPYQRAFIGLDPEEVVGPNGVNKKTKQKPGLLARLFSRTGTKPKPKWWHGGSSLLLHTGPRSYTFIGEEIYSFELEPYDPEITEFWSEMGNSSVPYPYAVSPTKTYLMIEKTHVYNASLISVAPKNKSQLSPYALFYNYSMLTGSGPAPFGKKLDTSQLRSQVIHQHKQHKRLYAFKLLHERIW